jgi:antitoxin FitA
VHRKLKARAASKGMSLSDYLLKEVERLAQEPTMEEFLERLSRREPAPLQVPAADVVRAERDSR